MRLLGECCHRSHGIEPPCGGIGTRRNAVIGQAIPGRQFENRQVRRNESKGFGNRRQPLPVAHDEHQRLLAQPGGDRRQREGFISVGNAVDDGGAVLRKADGIDKAHGSVVTQASGASR